MPVSIRGFTVVTFVSSWSAWGIAAATGGTGCASGQALFLLGGAGPLQGAGVVLAGSTAGYRRRFARRVLSWRAIGRPP